VSRRNNAVATRRLLLRVGVHRAFGGKAALAFGGKVKIFETSGNGLNIWRRRAFVLPPAKWSGGATAFNKARLANLSRRREGRLHIGAYATCAKRIGDRQTPRWSSRPRKMRGCNVCGDNDGQDIRGRCGIIWGTKDVQLTVRLHRAVAKVSRASRRIGGNMPRMKNGLIAFMRDQVVPGPKLLSIEVTNTFPLIALTPETHLIRADQQSEILKGYCHLSIPADLRLHITGPDDRVFFDVTPVWEALEKENSPPLHYFTLIGPPARIDQPLVRPGERRVWNQAALFSPFQDNPFNPSTRLFIDFFLQRENSNLEGVVNYPFAMSGMRLGEDRHGSVIGPYPFSEIQRKTRPKSDIGFVIRFGFAEIDNNDAMYIYTPLKVYEKRRK